MKFGIKTLRHTALGLGCAALLTAGSALAQNFPDKPVHIIVPFPGGSVTDTFTRIIGDNMAATLGQTVLTEPKPGAGTEIGTKYVIAQPADGYTILMATPSLAIKSSLIAPPFDARKDVTAIGSIGGGALFLVVNSASIKAKTAREVIDYAKANPGKLNMVNYGVGTLGHLMGELFAYKYGLKMVSVPYNGAVAASVALAQGNGDLGFNVTSVMGTFVQQGKVQIIAAGTNKRDPLNPTIPSMAESGVPDYNVSSWSGFVAPAGTPRAVIMKLNEAIGAAMKVPAVRQHFDRVKIVLSEQISTPEEFATVINNDINEFSKLIRDANLKFD